MSEWSDDDLNALRGAVGSFQPGEDLGQNYRIVELIGVGGQGEVYKVINHADKRHYVAKVFLDDPSNARFENECRVFDSLQQHYSEQGAGSTRIVRPHPSLTLDGRKVLILEYIDGDTLEQFMRRTPSLSVRHAVQFIKQILDGLGFLHQLGIVHRDIKPSNIKVTGGGNRLVIIDFSIALVDDDLEAVPYSGTPEYSPPESAPTKSWDVFSVGVLLHQLVTGRLPMWERGGRKPAGGDDRLVIPRELALHPSLSTCLCRSLAYDRAGRYANAIEFERALHAARLPVNIGGAAVGWVVRHPLQLIAIVLLFMLTNLLWISHARRLTHAHDDQLGLLHQQMQHQEKQLKEAMDRIKRLEIGIDQYASQEADKLIEQLKRERLDRYGLNLDAQKAIVNEALSDIARFAPDASSNARGFVEQRLNNELSLIRQTQIQANAGLPVLISMVEVEIDDPAIVGDAQELFAVIDIGGATKELRLGRRDGPRAVFWGRAREGVRFEAWRPRDEVVVRLRKQPSWLEYVRRWGSPVFLTRNIIRDSAHLASLQPRSEAEEGGWVSFPGEIGGRIRISGRIIPAE